VAVAKNGTGGGGTHNDRVAMREVRRWRLLLRMAMMVVVGHDDGRQQQRTQ